MATQQRTFTHTDADGDWIKICPAITTGRSRAVLKSYSPSIYVTTDDAPRVAVELLKAAGWKPTLLGTAIDAKMSKALELLSEVAEHFEEKEREAAEYDELKAEALKLYNIFNDRPSDSEWPIRVPEMGRWVETAKMARVLHRTETGADCA